MCGIVGIVNIQEFHKSLDDLNAMLYEVRHRGPDAEGLYVNENVALGHRRLSIIDTSHHAHQPFYYKDELVLVFNGAIYNYIELKDELIEEGYIFKTNSDTEVLLMSYLHWGEKCVEKFNGMWAFVIFDKKNNKLFCSRDHFGIKPFYYFFDDDHFLFSSEIKPILKIKKRHQANLKSVLHYLTFSASEYKEETFFKGIIKLPPSHNLMYDLSSHSFEVYRYYEIKFKDDIANLSIEDTLKKVDLDFEEAIKIRVRSDLKLGSSLSGGLDSSYILTKIFELSKNDKKLKDFTSITVGSINKKNDESNFARKVVETFNINYKNILPSKDEFLNRLEEIIYIQEEPFGGKSIHMQNFLMHEVNDQKIKVLLSGQGADELFLGYNFYITLYLRKMDGKRLYQLIKNNKFYFLTFIKSYLFYSRFKLKKYYYQFKMRNLKRQYFDEIDFEPIKLHTKSFDNYFELQKNEIFENSLPEMLKWEDKNSMMYGVESRLPFLDRNLVETCLSVNPDFKMYDGWTKYLIRKNIENKLPNEIVWRKNKIGFEPPFEEWWPSEEKIINTINNSKIINQLFKKKFKSFQDRDFEWRLYNLAVWEKQYKMYL